MGTPFDALDEMLSDAVNGVFAEMFEFRAMTTGAAGVDGPRISDASRQTFQAAGQWVSQTKSSTLPARGAVQDDNAHSWTVARPEIHIDDRFLIWKPRQHDRVVRIDTGDTYAIGAAPRPDGMGHTTLPLTSMKKPTT